MTASSASARKSAMTTAITKLLRKLPNLDSHGYDYFTIMSFLAFVALSSYFHASEFDATELNVLTESLIFAATAVSALAGMRTWNKKKSAA